MTTPPSRCSLASAGEDTLMALGWGPAFQTIAIAAAATVALCSSYLPAAAPTRSEAALTAQIDGIVMGRPAAA